MMMLKILKMTMIKKEEIVEPKFLVIIIQELSKYFKWTMGSPRT